MPGELEKMHEFLTRDDPDNCRKYHYNFERQAPRLYEENQIDSILDVIDYIKTECGPAANLEVTQLLILANQNQLGDSLIGPATIPQMLWYRSEQEKILNWRNLAYLYGESQPIDNTHDSFTKFRTNLARLVYSNSDISPESRVLGQFYSGEFDSAFSLIQANEFEDTSLREYYDDFIRITKGKYPSRGNVAIITGGWFPQGSNEVLGKHPHIGIQLGSENHRWRADFIIDYRFSRAKNKYEIDSLGQIISTDEFSNWLFGFDCGIKLIDNTTFSTDIFVGCGYDAIYSIKEAADPDKDKILGAFTTSIGLRHRFFSDKKKGTYIGGMIRYSLVDHNNPRGTDLSGNTLSISFMVGMSFHETLDQFLDKLNYKGSRRP